MCEEVCHSDTRELSVHALARGWDKSKSKSAGDAAAFKPVDCVRSPQLTRVSITLDS